jgi:hypothetical protein
VVIDSVYDSFLRIRDEMFTEIMALDAAGKLDDCYFHNWVKKDHSFEADEVDSEQERKSKFHKNLKELGYSKSNEGYCRMVTLEY